MEQGVFQHEVYHIEQNYEWKFVELESGLKKTRDAYIFGDFVKKVLRVTWYV